MRRLGILFIIVAMALCGGCQGSIYSNYRDVERLRPVQALGIDAENGAVTAAVAAKGATSDAPPAVLRHSAESIEQALAGIQNAFPEAQPYYAHVQYILFGRAAAEAGMEPWLEWIERNPRMRLDAAAFIARDSAAELILAAADEQGGTAEKLESLEAGVRELGEGSVVTIRALAAALAESGTGLCGAVRAADETDDIRFDQSASILPAGFAVFREGALCAFIEQEDAAGVLLLLGKPQGARVTLETGEGRVTVRLGSGSVKTSFDDAGAADIRCEADAVVVESEGEVDPEALSAALNEALRGQIERVLALQASLGCDFLDLLDDREAAEYRVSVAIHAEHGYGLRPQEGGER